MTTPPPATIADASSIVKLDFSVKLCRFLIPDTWRRHQLTLTDIHHIINQADVRSLWILGVYFNIRVMSSSAKLANNDEHSIIFSAKCMLIKRLMQEITTAATDLGINTTDMLPASRLYTGSMYPKIHHNISHVSLAHINMIRTLPADADVVSITFADGSSGLVLPAWHIARDAVAAYVLNHTNVVNNGFVKRQVTIGGRLYDISCEIVVLSNVL
jgi:hypothetical protein